MPVHRRSLGLEAARNLVGVEAEGARVGPHEAERVGLAGQIDDPAAFQCLEVLLADAQRRGDVRQGPPDPFARSAQIRSCPGCGGLDSGMRHAQAFRQF
jgi:hypothetical protein